MRSLDSGDARIADKEERLASHHQRRLLGVRTEKATDRHKKKELTHKRLRLLVLCVYLWNDSRLVVALGLRLPRLRAL